MHRAARIAAAGHGGQILVSQSTRDLVGANGLRDLGEHRLKDLTAPERIYQVGEGDFPSLKSLNNSNLPLPADPLIGRKKEFADVLRLLRGGRRLVTVTGPGGIGKTRFALEVAAEAIEDFRDGVWWVGLAPVRDPTLVVSTIAVTIGAQAELEHELRSKQLLLLLDNFEQVVDAAGELAALQAASSSVALLVTSREPLHIAGEREYQLSPLAESAAVELFTQRAASISADYPQLVELCDRVDRLPLAIELTAARTKVLSVTELLQRLDERLPLLTSRRRDVDERQRTLRATIEWSYDLLGAEDKELFGRLSVFAGGFDVTAARDICDAEVDALESLVDKSLLRRGDDGRFFMLETIREFAHERLNIEIAERHAAYYLGLAERTQLRGRGSELSQALSLLDAERENIRAALSFYEASAAADELARLIDVVAYYWIVRGDFREGDRWIETALNRHPPAAQLVAELLIWRSDFVRILGDLDGALSVSEEALVRARDLNEPRLIARSLHEVGESYAMLGDGAAATAAFEEAIEIFRQAGESPAETLGNLGDLALAEGRFEEAARRIKESRTLLADADIGTRLIADYNYVVALLHLDRTDDASDLLKDVLVGLRELSYVEGVALALLAAAMVLTARGNDEAAAEIFGAGERILDETGAHIGPTERRLYDPLTALIRDRELDEPRSAGRALTLEEAVDAAVRSLD